MTTEVVENVDLKEDSSSCPMEEPTTINPDEVKQEVDPYAYLDRRDFTSEKFKIEIKNLPKFYGISEFRKLLNEKLKLNANKIKTPRRNSPYAFVCFRNEEDRVNAIKVISEYKWKGKELQAILAKPAPDPLVKKRKDAESEENSTNKKTKIDDRPQQERLESSATPYCNIPYEEQLKLKQEEVKNVLRRIAKDLKRTNPDIRNWLDKQQSLYDGMVCQLLDIKHSPPYEGYRNKCEFTIGIDQETNLRTVGFRVGSYANGTTSVAPIDNMKHVSDTMKLVVKVFQDFVRTSDLDVYNPETGTGHFRYVIVRTAPEQIMMVVSLMNPESLSEDKLAEYKKSLIEYFSAGPGTSAKVTSLYHRISHKRSQPGENSPIPLELLWGDSHIYETMLGLKFRISPYTFFQVNVPAAEILYNSIIEFADPSQEESTILDVCCGSGTIGLCFAKKCSQILGVEISTDAIEDAKENARMNNIENSEFLAGKAEEATGNMCYKAKHDVTAILDPPRAGCHQKTIFKVRKISKIKKVVYASCDPLHVLLNFVNLGRIETKTVHGDPLLPVKAVAVDLFPHTAHCELVICFERWSKIQKEFEAANSANSNTEEASA